MHTLFIKFPTYWRTDEQTVLVAEVPKLDFIIQTHKLSALILVHSKAVQQQISGFTTNIRNSISDNSL
jgi:hypothetical protein